MTFTLPDLPYSFDALEPYIDARTMEIHHDKHHAGYVAKLNAAVEGTDFSSRTVEELISSLNDLPEDIRTAVRNNGGGHYNHSFFWKIMAPSNSSEPCESLSAKINSDFGSLDKLKESFAAQAGTRFGSGWAWLTVDSDGKLYTCSSPNQDNPLMVDAGMCGRTPLLAIDVWEHAYYLHYQNRRPDYVSAWWNVINWDAVNDHWTKATTGKCASNCSCASDEHQ